MKRINFLIFILPALVYGQQLQKIFTLNDIFNSQKFSGKAVSGIQWMKNGKQFSYQRFDSATNSDKIFVVQCSQGTRSLRIDASLLKMHPDDPPFRFSSYQWSPQEDKILFVSAPPDKQYLSRLTPEGNYFLYDLRKKTLQRLTNVREPQFNHKFSPDGLLLGFVRGNNVMLLDIASGRETMLTTDGAAHVINGKFDWVYEEEFGISDGWQWSPDGIHIAFWRLDESRVPDFKMMNYMANSGEEIVMKYPQPGDPNSIVKIGVVSLESKIIQWMDLGPDDDIYVPRIQWLPDGQTLAIQRLNRLQNTLEILAGNRNTGATRMLLGENSKTWIEEGHELRFLKKDNQFLKCSEQDGYNHIYRYDLNGKQLNQVTAGKWDVRDLEQVDEDRKLIYFTAAAKTPREQQLFVVGWDGNNMQQLTRDGFSHSIDMSPDARFYIDKYSSTSTPVKTELFDITGKSKWMIEENSIPSLNEYQLNKTEYFTFKTSDGIELNGSLIKPTPFDVRTKYPVLFDVYGGPGSQSVTNSWGESTGLWQQLLSQKGYIIVSVDGRGTGGRGKAFKETVYHHLGLWEVNDLVEAVKYLNTFTFVDSSRIGIWGWSYGGYMAVSALLRGSDYFKTAVAVAPVTDWRLYDDIYTERYMGLPTENPDGYKESSTLEYTDRLKGNLLIIHGTADDNVHWQNTIQLVHALEKSGKQFRTMFYPNRNHAIRGGTTRLHLFELITNYLLEKL
ncbi:MAG: S9 family peptidase [Ignavibacteriae bacterium]|nr:MAG: S9 family peptidase [Ignavibacteriota bacterium]